MYDPNEKPAVRPEGMPDSQTYVPDTESNRILEKEEEDSKPFFSDIEGEDFVDYPLPSGNDE